VALLLGLVGMVVVPGVLTAVLPDTGPLPGDRLDIGYGASLRPPDGGRLELSGSRPGTGEVTVVVGSHRLKLTAVEVPERPGDFARHTRRKFSRDEGLRPGPPQEVRTDAGVRGERGDLRPADSWGGESGCYALFAAESAGAVAVISGVDGCAAVPQPLWASVTSMTFEPVEQW
jgi:hypothetical protein